jgi:hypothetical protein
VAAFIDAALRGRRTPAARVKALFAAFAERVEQGRFAASCAAGTVCLDLEAGDGPLRAVVARALDLYVETVAGHFECGDRRRSRAFAGLLVSAIEGAYIRSRAQRTSEPFREAGAWLAAAASREFAG